MKTAVEAGFASETRDPAWRSDAQRTLSEKSGVLLKDGSSLRDVECHSTMCKMDLTYDNGSAARDSLQKFAHDPRARPWNAANYSFVSEPDNQGHCTGYVYFAREGSSLPSIDEQAAE